MSWIEGNATPGAEADAAGVVAGSAELVQMRHAAHGLDLGPALRVETPLAGPYPSPFRGRGLDFDEVRAYQPGDDVRQIDWRVTARTGRVHSKVFHEEHDRPLWLMLDAGPSMRFGTRRAFKSVAAARAAALLAWSAQLGGDPVGGVVRSPERVSELPPAAGEGPLMDLLGAISRATAASEEDGAPGTLDCLARLRERVRSGSRVFVLSDFYDFDDRWRLPLSDIGRRCDTTCILVYDALEAEAPPAGRYRVSDGNGVHAISSGGGGWRRAYSAPFDTRREALKDFCRSHRIQLLSLRTDDDPAAALGAALHPERLANRNRRPS
ncbi:MAG: DUF58 domain-containing protein [Myxococcota bacterium]|jgi:uncharacterized protein (DUF58 family)|nr:DUF58 domain-containing protein [Deltaproteobacteria bacterium]MCP4243092.1 DUF58 domain-containing protein [bacterium]MDP6076504.1 DUF58 domain-containing protein [Myxococcota bacterium]MDP6242206.1 DUF58 domain-containing protein [Myxococcota bacterium]MDP7075684.1 DUF58 domain-containing protein [Myxococcota bacterium]